VSTGTDFFIFISPQTHADWRRQQLNADAFNCKVDLSAGRPCPAENCNRFAILFYGHRATFFVPACWPKKMSAFVSVGLRLKYTLFYLYFTADARGLTRTGNWMLTHQIAGRPFGRRTLSGRKLQYSRPDRMSAFVCVRLRL